MAASSRYGIVVSRFNREMTDALLKSALAAFQRHRVARSRVDLVWVPGAFELPVAALRMCKSGRYQAVVALGCIVAAETPQFAYISQAVLHGLTVAALTTGIPVTCGVITAKSWRHAKARARPGSSLNRGQEAVEAALEMSELLKKRAFHAR